MIWNISIIATTALDTSWYCNTLLRYANQLLIIYGEEKGCVRYCAGYAGCNLKRASRELLEKDGALAALFSCEFLNSQLRMM